MRSWRRRCARAGAEVVAAAAERPREWRTYALLELAWARAARAAAAAGDPRAPPAGGRCTRRRPRRCWRPTRARSASTRPPRATARGGTASGSGRWRSGGSATRGCWCRGARAGWPRRRSRTATRSSCRCRWSRAGRPASATSPAITYGANPAKKGLDRVLAAWDAARHEGEELVVAGLDEAGAKRAGLSGERRPLRGHARRAPTTARCCAARASSSARPAARTTGSPSSRRSRTAASSSPPPRPAPTRRCRSRASSTRGSSAGSPRGSGPRSTTRRPATPRGRPSCWRRGDPRRSTRWCASSCSRG